MSESQQEEDPGQSDFFKILQQLAAAPADELDRPERTPSDAKVAKKVSDAEKRAAQEHGFRNDLFKTIKRTLNGTLLAAVAIMVAYIVSAWDNVDPIVMVSFFSAVVVQTIGLSYIVANYVFDRENRGRGSSGGAGE